MRPEAPGTSVLRVMSGIEMSEISASPVSKMVETKTRFPFTYLNDVTKASS